MSINPRTKSFSRISMIAVLFAAALSGFNQPAEAVTAPSIYLATTSGQAVVGSKIALTVRETSGAVSVNAIELGLTYPSDKLQYVSTDASASPFDVAASSTGGGGTVSLSRGKVGGITGDQAVATIYFNVLAAGTANIGYNGNNHLLKQSDSTDLNPSLVGGSYSLQSTSQIGGCSSIEQQAANVYRLYDPVTYKHFYTPYMCEYYALPRLANYQAEGPAWNTTPSTSAGAVPVWRLYNPSTRIHHWTTTQQDIDAATSQGGYVVEGIGFYAVSPSASPIYPVYRLYNPKTYLHLWTLSMGEVSSATQYAGYVFEGPAFSSQ